jgi:hypothetical protein
MFQLIHGTNWRELLAGQLPSLVISLAIAQLFYKFGAFLPECAAFLATWYAIGAALAWMRRLPRAG